MAGFFQWGYSNGRASLLLNVSIDIKQFLYRPGQALRALGVQGPGISRQSVHECSRLPVIRTGRLYP